MDDRSDSPTCALDQINVAHIASDHLVVAVAMNGGHVEPPLTENGANRG
jgi:hypothetical protein